MKNRVKRLSADKYLLVQKTITRLRQETQNSVIKHIAGCFICEIPEIA